MKLQSEDSEVRWRPGEGGGGERTHTRAYTRVHMYTHAYSRLYIRAHMGINKHVRRTCSHTRMSPAPLSKYKPGTSTWPPGPPGSLPAKRLPSPALRNHVKSTRAGTSKAFHAAYGKCSMSLRYYLQLPCASQTLCPVPFTLSHSVLTMTL